MLNRFLGPPPEFLIQSVWSGVIFIKFSDDADALALGTTVKKQCPKVLCFSSGGDHEDM